MVVSGIQLADSIDVTVTTTTLCCLPASCLELGGLDLVYSGQTIHREDAGLGLSYSLYATIATIVALTASLGHLLANTTLPGLQERNAGERVQLVAED